MCAAQRSNDCGVSEVLPGSTWNRGCTQEAILLYWFRKRVPLFTFAFGCAFQFRERWRDSVGCLSPAANFLVGPPAITSRGGSTGRLHEAPPARSTARTRTQTDLRLRPKWRWRRRRAGCAGGGEDASTRRLSLQLCFDHVSETRQAHGSTSGPSSSSPQHSRHVFSSTAIWAAGKGALRVRLRAPVLRAGAALGPCFFRHAK